MSLTELQIDQLLTEFCQRYLTTTQFTFATLKNLLLDELPIPFLDAQIKEYIAQVKATELAHVTGILEQKACAEQEAIDQTQAKKDALILHEEEIKQKKLRQKINALSADVTTNQRTLVPQLNFASSFKINTRNLYPLSQKLISLDHQLQAAEKALQKSQQLTNRCLAQQQQRQQRIQGRIAYQTTKKGIKDALSAEQYAIFIRSVQTQKEALETIEAQLLTQQEQTNFTCFLEQISTMLPKIKLEKTEITALTTLVNLIKQHIQLKTEINCLEETLLEEKRKCTLKKIKSQNITRQLEKLTQEQPQSAQHQQQLVESNKTLQQEQQHYKTIKNKLVIPMILLFASTFASIIPLLLVLGKAIPFFATPLLIYTLFALPALVLLLTSLSFVVATTIYTYKYNSVSAQINDGLTQLSQQTKKHIANGNLLTKLQLKDLPEYDLQIKRSEEKIRSMQTTLAEKKELALDTHQKAEQMMPNKASPAKSDTTSTKKANLNLSSTHPKPT